MLSELNLTKASLPSELFDRPVCFHDHLKDVVTILQYILNNLAVMSGDERAQTAQAFRCFIHRRAFPTIARRVETGCKLWGKHPILLIQEFAQNHNPNPDYVSHPFQIPNIPKTVTDALEHEGINSNDGLWVINAANIHHWLQFITRTFNHIVELTISVRHGHSSATRKLRPERTVNLILAMRTLYYLLCRANILRELCAAFSDSGVERFLTDRYGTCFIYHPIEMSQK